MSTTVTTSAGIRELKSNLSAYLRRVKAGETVVITEHGKPVGRIVPIAESIEDRIWTLVDSGLVEWNGERLTSEMPRVKLHGSRTIADIVSENRE